MTAVQRTEPSLPAGPYGGRRASARPTPAQRAGPHHLRRWSPGPRRARKGAGDVSSTLVRLLAQEELGRSIVLDLVEDAMAEAVNSGEATWSVDRQHEVARDRVRTAPSRTRPAQDRPRLGGPSRVRRAAYRWTPGGRVHPRRGARGLAPLQPLPPDRRRGPWQGDLGDDQGDGVRHRIHRPFNGRLLRGLMPNGRLQSIEDGGHLFLLDQPQRSAAMADEFLRGPR
jgi:hypothetical protein